MTTDEKLSILRDEMEKSGLAAYIVPTADPHLSEYVPEHYRLRHWLSGFDGSAGTLVVTADKSGLWTDGRYYIQAEKQLSELRAQWPEAQVARRSASTGALSRSAPLWI